MAETRRAAAPLLQAGQAQKHVTVNEALLRLDAFTTDAAQSRTMAAPPVAAPEGAVYVVAGAGAGAWDGQGGRLAARIGGGWVFADPQEGRALWVVDEARLLRRRQGEWAAEGSVDQVNINVAIKPGEGFETLPIIPDKAVVVGVSGRVTQPLSGPGLTGWRLGVAGAGGRYGGGYGLDLNAYAMGVTGQPLAYYQATPLLVEPEGGAFEGGALRLRVHFLSLVPPAPV